MDHHVQLLGGGRIGAVIWVFIDNFRRDDHSGSAKALSVIVIIVVPIIGVFAYGLGRPGDLGTA
jgi:hypothetical protein